MERRDEKEGRGGQVERRDEKEGRGGQVERRGLSYGGELGEDWYGTVWCSPLHGVLVNY